LDLTSSVKSGVGWSFTGNPFIHRFRRFSLNRPQTAPAAGWRLARQPQQQEAPSSQIAGLGQGHRQGEGRGHGPIHRIAALPQDRRPGRRSPPLLAGHHPPRRPKRLEALAGLLEFIEGWCRGRSGVKRGDE
jgi:hypothetical protein